MNFETGKLDVIIVGAGLGGLACAVACGQQGLKTIILEKAETISAVGLQSLRQIRWQI